MASNSSTAKYRYDTGANVEATSPAPAGQTYGKTTKRVFDSLGRLEKNSVYVNTTEKAYTRYEYSTNGTQSKVFSTLVDVDNDGNIAEDEALTETITDGAGRMIKSRTPHPGSTGGWTGVLTSYDILGRLSSTSVPTEIDSSYEPVGDDDARGFIYNFQYYDWKNRVIRMVPSGSTGSDDKDTLITYEGCGCAGGLITTVKGPKTDAFNAAGTAQTNKRRWEKYHEDILGRRYKTELWDLDGGSIYSTVKTTFNGRDQATVVREYVGSDTSSTYQDTTMSYDGHGRVYQSHKPEQRVGSTLKYATYTYNQDDSIQTITDGRGVVTTYTYENVSGVPKRPLVTNIAWNPGSTGVTDTPDVSFSYDNLGNRTAMTDGLGSVSYAYSSLSQMTSETRDFTDTLADSPGGNGQYELEYTYHVGGGLKSYKDPWDKEIAYTNDNVGRLTSVTGTSFGGVTGYASNPQYRAWGGLKHLEFIGWQMSATYNDGLRPTGYLLNQIADTSVKIFDKTYQYYPDGKLKLADEAITAFNKLDRLFKYDQVGQIKEAKSGIEAHGEVETDLTKLPYRQSYTYNAFGNLTGRDSTLWNNTTDWDFEYEIANNRVSGAGYDADGRQTMDQDDPIDFYYDSAGWMEKTSWYEAYETLLYQEGDGADAKRSQRTYNTQTQQWSSWETAYFITSSVLGRVVTETTGTGKKKYTYVVGAGPFEARQKLDSQNNETVELQMSDASGLSSYGYHGAELDGLGNNVGSIAPSGPRNKSNSLSANQPIIHDDSEMSACSLNGTMMPCSMLTAMSWGTSFFSVSNGLPWEARGKFRAARNNPAFIANEILHETSGPNIWHPWRPFQEGGAHARVLFDPLTWSLLLGTPQQKTEPLPTKDQLKAAMSNRLDLNNKECRRFMDDVLKNLKIDGPYEDLLEDVLKNRGFYGTGGAHGYSGDDKGNIGLPTLPAASDDRGKYILQMRFVGVVFHELLHRKGKSHEGMAKAVEASLTPAERQKYQLGKGDSAASTYMSWWVNEKCKFNPDDPTEVKANLVR